MTDFAFRSRVVSYWMRGSWRRVLLFERLGEPYGVGYRYSNADLTWSEVVGSRIEDLLTTAKNAIENDDDLDKCERACDLAEHMMIKAERIPR